jgi:peptidoglycan/LPS O-acetylase OafA/YrhL
MSHAFSLFLAKHAWTTLLKQPDRYAPAVALFVYPVTVAFVLLVSRITFRVIEDPAKRYCKSLVRTWFSRKGANPALRAELGSSGG